MTDYTQGQLNEVEQMGIHVEKINHPAVYSNEFIPIFANELQGAGKVLDPFAGTGKLGDIKQFGFNGTIYANDIEPEWIELGRGKCDVVSCADAEKLCELYPRGFFDAICTSPTYGNRMADHHKAKDGSKRITYTHCLGRQLSDENTGKMQWGDKYREKHKNIYRSLLPLLKDDGIFILNVSNHIRNGEEQMVAEWHKSTIEQLGCQLLKDIIVRTKRNRFGANSDKRVEFEHIYVFKNSICERGVQE